MHVSATPQLRPDTRPLEVVVLVSGSGSLLQALIDAEADAAARGQRSPFTIVAVGADRECAGLERAMLAGIPTFVVDTERDLVYAGVKGEPAGIVTLALDRSSGTLTERSRLDLPAGGMNYLALARGGSVLLGASMLGATVMPHAIYLHSRLSVDHAGADADAAEPGSEQAEARRRALLRASRWDVVFALVIGLSRVYLGHHWFTDVLAGWLLGAAWLALVITAHRIYLTARAHRPAGPAPSDRAS